MGPWWNKEKTKTLFLLAPHPLYLLSYQVQVPAEQASHPTPATAGLSRAV